MPETGETGSMWLVTEGFVAHRLRDLIGICRISQSFECEVRVRRGRLSRQPSLGAPWRAVCIDVRSSTLWSSMDLSRVGASVEDQLAVANRNVIARIVIHLHRRFLRAQPVAHRVARPLL